ncbi:Flagellar regulatory protein FleQ [Labilithrix luteola]|uniref:Flagellar regulatory protein FleQ n=1 Tax=Labilithrix luteola TaxID=1391654 RepID=A0A0K1QA67_9BACT|nr:sigma-54 dependent transcriptional regulator [Labilithrix luteola]AKV02686.1 Flagellar regulatory protein FleQ [Labilithrix luteola]
MPQTKRNADIVLEPIVRSLAMRQLDRVVNMVANKDVIVTFIGESGTGKEIFARRLHESSDRRRGPFVPINCAAIPEALFESELFGHEKGAFTGASERARGKIEAAAGGTLFLDELGDMPIGVQAKLLRFLENRRYMRVGGSTKITADIRLVTATHRPLEDEVKAGRFRPDLFYRIEGITLSVPPLRERVADIMPLVQQFVAHSCIKHGTKPPRLTRATTNALRSYAWPGNVRELRNVVQLLCLMRDGKSARVRDLPERMRTTPSAETSSPGSSSARQNASEVIEVRLDMPLSEAVDRILHSALVLERGNRSRAARRLSVGLRTMQRYIARTRDLAIEPADD